MDAPTKADDWVRGHHDEFGKLNNERPTRSSHMLAGGQVLIQSPLLICPRGS